MKKWVKVLLAVLIVAGYLSALRYVAPSNEPYFVLSIAVIGSVAWLLGVTAGLAVIVLLTPATHYIYDQFSFSISYTLFSTSPAYIVLKILTAVVMGYLPTKFFRLTRRERMLAEANESLQASLASVREMGGIHSLCSSCKSIMDDDGSWTKIDAYLKDKTKAEISHGMCPDCAKKYEMPESFLAKQEKAS